MTRPLRRLARPVGVLALALAFAGSLGGLAAGGGTAAPGAPGTEAPVAELSPGHAALVAADRCAQPRDERV